MFVTEGQRVDQPGTHTGGIQHVSKIDELNVSKKSIDKERGDKENRKGQGGRRRERRRVLANEDAFLRQKGGLCK